MPDPLARYDALAAVGAIERDPAQEAAAVRLTRLNERITLHRLARKSSSLGWLFAKREAAEPGLRGIYLWGDVGRGKTMLTDLFFATCPVKRKRRVHFHEFLREVHERLNDTRRKLKSGEIRGGDPIDLVAGELAGRAWVLCLDEFQVTDIADAMILGRLFGHLFARGAIVVATSNVAPGELYRDGLNRALFMPFIRLIEERMDIVHLAARVDFRLEKLTGMRMWHVPADEAADRALDLAWRRLTGGGDAEPLELRVQGHVLRVPRAAMGAARFDFTNLCGAPLGAGDYLRLAQEFHTMLIDRVPIMTYAERNEAKRFIILIDTIYDAGVKLIASAAAEPFAIYRAGEGFEVGEFKRTVSRLIEMSSQEYLGRPRGPRRPAADVPSLVET